MQGQLDTDLSELGVRQAAAAAKVLASRGPRLIISSDLRRARDTAAALADQVGMGVATDRSLRETHLGEWQGLTHNEVDRSEEPTSELQYIMSNVDEVFILEQQKH